MIDLAAAYGVAEREGPDWNTAMLRLAAQRHPGEILHLPAGEFLVTQSLDWGANPPRLVADDPDRTRLYHGAVSQPLIVGTGTWDYLGGTDGIGRTTGTAFPARSTTIPMTTSGLGIQAGDIVQLRDQTQKFYSGFGGEEVGCVGQTVEVRRVDPDQLALTGTLHDAYTADAKIRRMRPIDRPILRGFSIRHPTPPARGGVPVMGTSAALAIKLSNAREMVIEDVWSFGLERQFLSPPGCVGGIVKGLRSYDARDDLAGAPYVFKPTQGTQGLRAFDCRGDGGRHLVTSAGNPGDVMPQWIVVQSCEAVNHTSAGFDMHSNGRFWQFIDCTVRGSYEDPLVDHAETVAGFQLRAFDTQLVRPQVFDAPTGIHLSGATRATVDGGLVEGCGTGILVRQNAGTSIERAVIRNPTDVGVDVGPEWSPAGFVQGMAGLRMRDVDVEGSPAEGAYRFSPWFDYPGVDFTSLRSTGAAERIVGVIP